MSKETKTANARAKLDSIYNKLDEKCGFKEPDKRQAKEQQKKKGYTGMPEVCKTCSYRRNFCWVGYTKKGQCGEDYCQFHNIDEVEVKRLAEIAKAIALQKGGDSNGKVS